jgi:hypothetical protein
MNKALVILLELLAPSLSRGVDGKRLEFLQDARVAQTRHLSQATQYVHSTWASKNGLTRRDSGAPNE